MKHIVLAFVLCACAGESRVDTIRTSLDTVHAVLAGSYETVDELCDSREDNVVNDSSLSVESTERQLAAIRTECDQVLQPILDVLEGTEKTRVVIDIPWVQEAL